MTLARPLAPAAPERTCIGCRRKRPQPELVRVVRTEEGSLLVSRTAAGRGAWLCAGSTACLELARKRRAFGRALRVTVEDDAVIELQRRFEGS